MNNWQGTIKCLTRIITLNKSFKNMHIKKCIHLKLSMVSGKNENIKIVLEKA